MEEGMAGADSLVAMLPADIFSSADASDTAAPDSTEESAAVESFDDGSDPSLDAAVPDATAREEPAVEEPPAEEQQEQAVAEPPSDLPEGVRAGKNRRGEEGVFVEKARWEAAIYPHHKLVRETSDLLGEPLTVEAVKLRNAAFIGQEKLYSDMLSGDPAAQSAVVEHFFQEAQKAVENGDVGSDPMVPFTETFYSALREKSPDAYAKLRTSAAKDLGAELYQEAAQLFRAGRTDEANNLYRSVGHMLATVGLSYHKEGAREGFLSTAGEQSEADRLRQENQRLQGQLTGRSGQEQTAQFDTWKAQTKQAVQASVLSDAIQPVLKEAETAWSKLKGGPEAFRDLVVERMRTAVLRTISEDKGFQERSNDLHTAAKRAASAQRRTELAGQIQQAYVNRAKLAVEAHRRDVLDFAAKAWKDRSDTNNKRQAAGQTQRTPSGAHAPAPRSIVPPAPATSGDGFFNADSEVRKLTALIG